MNFNRVLHPFLTPLTSLASRWVGQQEAIIIAQGRELTATEQNDARMAGVTYPETIRIMVVATIIPPQQFPLSLAAKLVNLIGKSTAGITLRYGIYIRKDCAGYRDNRNLYVHEFVHVSQYERMGSIHAFLKAYLRECLDPGYPLGPLEQEAIQKAHGIVGHE